MPDPFLPELDITVAKAIADADQMLKNSGFDVPSIATPSPVIQDGDTIDNKRIMGYDTAESFKSDKAQRILDQYGLDLDQQKALGLAGKDHLKELLKNPEYSQFEDKGFGAMGRRLTQNDPLAEKMISDGFAVPTDRYDPKKQELYRRAVEKETNLFGTNREEMESLRQYNIDRQKPGYLSRTGESVDAFQSGAVQAVGKLGDFVTDVVAWGADKTGSKKFAKFMDESFEKMSSSEYADKVTGFDRREANFAMAEATHQWKTGDYAGALKTALTTPEVVAESLPLMIEMMVGGGKAKEGLTGVKRLGSYLKANSGLAAVIGQETNAQAEEYETLHGEKPNAVKLAQMTAMNTVMFSLDRLTFKQITGLKDGLKSAAQALPDSTKMEIMKKAIALTASTGSAMAKEGAQEYVQTWGEILNVQAGTDLDSYMKVLNDEEAQREALTGGIMGAGAGGQIHLGAKAVKGTVDTVSQKVDETVKEIENTDKQVTGTAPSYDPVTSMTPFLDADPKTMSSVEKTQFVAAGQEELGKALDYYDTIVDDNPELAQEILTKAQDLMKVTQDIAEVDNVTKEAVAQDDKEAVDRTFGSIQLNMNVPVDTAETMLNSSHLDESQKASLSNYIERKNIYERLKGMGAVSEEVMSGKDSHFKGLDRFIPDIQNALKYSDGPEKAASLANKFATFAEQRVRKYNAVKDLYEKSKTEGPQVYEQKGFKPLVISAVADTAQGIKNSSKLVEQIKLEMEYSQSIKKEIDRIVPDASKAGAGDNQPHLPEVDFAGLDSTKEYKAADIRGTVEDLLRNPSKYPDSPTKTQFIQNNSKVINEIARDMKKSPEADTTGNPAKEPATEAKGETGVEAKAETKKEASKKPVEPQKAPQEKMVEEKVSEPSEPVSEPEVKAKPSVGSKLLTNTMKNTGVKGGAEIAITNWFEPKNRESKFAEGDNIFAVDSLDPQLQNTMLKQFNMFKNTFNNRVAAVLHPKAGNNKGTFIGTQFFNQKSDAVASALTHSPMSLLVKSNGDPKVGANRYFDDELIGAMMLSSFDWLAQNYQSTLIKTPEDINRFLGREEGTQVTDREMDLLAEKGTYKNLIVSELGNAIYKQLGMKLKEGVDGNAEGRLINDLGANALRVMEEMGLLVEHSVPTKELTELKKGTAFDIDEATAEKKVTFVRVASTGDLTTLKEVPTTRAKSFIDFYKGNGKQIAESFGVESFTTGPTFEKPTKVVKQVQRSTLGVPQKNRDAIKKQQETPWIVRTKNMEVLRKLPAKMVYKIAGYVEDLDTVHAARIKAVKGKNGAIEREYEQLMQFAEGAEADKPFYFNYVFWKNGRYGVDSNTVNPQSKKLHRHMIGIKSHDITIKPGSKELEQFKLAVSMAFGGKVDKWSKQRSLDHFDTVVNDPDVQEALGVVDMMLKSDKELSSKELDPIFKAVDGHEEFHTLDALIALHGWAVEGKNGTEPFKTGLAMETDAVTSGFILTLMQAPLVNDVMGWLNKGGIYKGRDFDNFGDWSETPGHLDSYQTLAKNVHERIANHPKMEILKDLVGSLADEKGITGFGRSFMKAPFMTFIYGSSINNIVESIGENALEDLYKKIEKVVMEKDREGLISIQKQLRDLGIPAVIYKDPLKRMDKRSEEMYKDIIKETYGKGVKEYLETEFEGVVNYRKQTNKAFKVMFEAFDVVFKKEVAKAKEAKGGLELTRGEIDDIVKSLHSMFPGIKPIFGKSADEKVSVIDRFKDLNIEDPSRKVESQFVSRIKPKQGDVLPQQSTSWSYDYSFQASAAAGPVVTIHYIDGSIITSPLMDFDSLGVHDAVNHSLSNVVEGTRSYNRSTLRTSASYSVSAEVLKALKASLGSLSTDEMKTLNKSLGKLSAAEVYKNYMDMAKEIQQKRKEIFSGVMRVAHSSHPDTMVEFDFAGDKKFKDVDSTVNEEPAPAVPKVETDLDAKDTVVFSSNGRDFNRDEFKAEFENEVQSENVLNIFEALDAHENTKVEPEFRAHMKHVLSSLVQKAMKPADKVSLKIRKEGDENFGAEVGQDIFINVADTKPNAAVKQSVQEVYTHEMLHHVLKYGVDEVWQNRRHLEDMFEHAKKHVTAEDFLLKDADGKVIFTHDEVTERAAAQEMYDYIFNNSETTATSSGELVSNHLHEFLVYGLSNPQLIKKLKSIPVLDKRVDPDASFFRQLLNKFMDLLDVIMNKIEGTKGKNSYEALYNLSQTIAGVNAKKTNLLKRVTVPAFKGVEKLNDVIKEAVSKGSGKVFKYVESNPNNVVTKSLKAVRNIPVITENPEVMAAIKQVARKFGFIEDGVFAQIAKEITGDRDKYGEWYALLRQSKKMIDQARMNTSTLMSKQINDMFSQPLEDIERRALNSIFLEADLEVLVGDYSMEDIRLMLTSDTMMETNIDVLEAKLAKLPDSKYYISRARGLGNYMAHNTNYLRTLPMNAYTIAQMHGTGLKPSGDPEVAEKLIDQLATLYALKYSTPEMKAITAKVIKREYDSDPAENGVAFMLGTHKAFKQKSLDTLFRGKKNLMIKGYTREIFDQDIYVQVAPLDHEEDMLRKGFKKHKVLNKHPEDKSPTPMALYISKDGMVTPWMKSIVSTTDQQARGTTLTKMHMASNDPFNKIHASVNIDKMREFNQKVTQREIKGAKIDKVSDYPIPLWDEHGNIVDYRYTMTKYTKVNLMGKEDRADVILGRMYGSLVDKEASKDVNSKVMDMLFKDYEDNYKKDPEAFVRIAPDADKKYKEIYDVLPDQMRYEMEKMWGGKELYVRRDIIDLVFGYRKIALANSKFFQDKHTLQRMVKLTGKIWTEFISIVKVRIAILTPDVLIDNIISNMITSMYYGVPAGYMIQKQHEALTALKQYKEKSEQLQRLKNKQEAGLPYSRAKMVQLEEHIRNNPVKDLIDEGVFQSIVEDVDTKNFQHRTKTGQYVDTLAKKTLPDTAVQVGKQAYMTEDTASFQFMLKATQFSDFVARYAMYHYEVDKKGTPKDKALEKIIETFIDYDAPTNRYLQWMNDMGLVMFTKYFLRIQRVIFKILKSNPGHAMAGIVAQELLGDLSDSMDSGLMDTNLVDKIHLSPLPYFEEFLSPPGAEILSDAIKEVVK